MKRQEVLKLYNLTKLPTKVEKLPKGVRGIAKVSREFGDDDFAIFMDGRCVKDSGFRFRISGVVQYYYDAPVVEEKAVDKLAELQKMADRAAMEKLGQELSDDRVLELEENKVVRPTVYKDMMAFIKEHKLTESKGNLPKEEAVALIDKYFA